jgi:signal transduction histidine kinase
MNPNIKIFLLCPVPETQKPINEYISLKENFLTNWTTFKKENYYKTIINIYILFLALSFFFTFPNTSFWETNIFKYIIFNLFITNILLLILFFTLYLNWYQIKNRFEISRLIYEESSWYDSQVWEKPFLLIKNDKLLQTQNIEPIIQRLSRAILIFFIFNLFLEICLQIF